MIQKKYFYLILTTLFFQFSFVQGADSLEVKYIFWSPPKYSLNNSEYKFAGSLFSIGNYKTEFTNTFDQDSEEYNYLKKSETKLKVGNILFAIPAGLCFGFAIATEKHRTAFIIAGSALALGDIYLGISSYQDLKVAVRKRNKRIIMPTVGIKF